MTASFLLFKGRNTLKPGMDGGYQLINPGDIQDLFHEIDLEGLIRAAGAGTFSATVNTHAFCLPVRQQ